MTFATLILDSLYAGLIVIALGWLSDGLQARHRRREAGRPADPFADFDARNRQYACGGPHLTAARERAGWVR